MSENESKPVSDLDRLVGEVGGKFSTSKSKEVFRSGKSRDDESARAVSAFKQKAARSVEDVAQDEAQKQVADELDEMRKDPEPETKLEQKKLEQAQLEQVLLATQSAQMRFENSIAQQKLTRQRRQLERMENIEDQLEPLDLENYFLQGTMTQKVPVNQHLRLVFFTPSFDTQAVAAEVAQDMIKERGLQEIDLTKLPERVRNEEEGDFHEKRTVVYGAASLATFLEMVNEEMRYGKPASLIHTLGPDEQKEAIRKKAESLLKISASLLREFITHQGAFIARVANQLEDVDLLRQTQGNS